MQITGKIIIVLPLASGTSQKGNAWERQDYVLETTTEKFPHKFTFSVLNEDIEKLNLQLGHEYEVSIDVNAREYNGKWYNSFTAWNARQIDVAPIPAPPAPVQQQMPLDGSGSVDDLPW